MEVTVFSQKTCSSKAGSLVGEQSGKGRRPRQGAKTDGPTEGHWGGRDGAQQPRPSYRCPCVAPVGQRRSHLRASQSAGTGARASPGPSVTGGSCWGGLWTKSPGAAALCAGREGAPVAGRPTQRSGRRPLGSGVQWGPVHTSGKGPEGTPATGTSLAACSVGMGSRARTTSHPPTGGGGGHNGSELGCGFGAAGPKPAVLVSLSLTCKVGCWRVLILRPVERV